MSAVWRIWQTAVGYSAAHLMRSADRSLCGRWVREWALEVEEDEHRLPRKGYPCQSCIDVRAAIERAERIKGKR